jgi:hypothetical protein
MYHFNIAMDTKTKKIVIVSSVIGVLAIAATAIILRGKRKSLQAKIASGSRDVISPAQTTSSLVSFPIGQGSSTTAAQKNAVKVVQRYINAKASVNSYLGIGMLKEDGIFGPLTEAALYKLAGIREVSYSLYMDMQNYLQSAPELLSPNAPPYDSPVPDYLSPNADPYDPGTLKNDLFNTLNL